MAKRRSTVRKVTKKPLAGGKRARKQRTRSAAKRRGQGLSLVEGEFGQSLEVRARLGLSRKHFVGLVPMSPRNLAYLESGKPPTRPLLRHLRSLDRLVAALAEVMPDEPIGRWLQQPNKTFGGQKPIDVIDRGEVDRIWKMIFDLRGR